MKHDLTKPCAGCPFRKDGEGVKLHHARIREIHRSVSKGIAFACHKTVDHDEGEIEDDDGGPRLRRYNRREQACAGALAYGLTVGDKMGKFIIECRVGRPEKLEALRATQNDVYESLGEWLSKGTT